MMEWLRKNDIFTRALALFAAVILWAFALSTEDTDMTKSFSHIPLEFSGMEMLNNNDLVITQGAQSSISLKVSGKVDRLSTVDEDSIRAIADLSHVTAPGTYSLKYQVTTSVSDVTINKVTNTVEIVVDRMVSKPVAIDLSLSGKLEEGYIFDKHLLKPDAITVTGPETVLSRIVKAKASYDISELKESTETTLGFTLLDAEGNEVKDPHLKVNTPSVQLAVNIRQTGEIPLVLNVDPFGFIDEEVVVVDLEPATVKINGDPEVVSTLNHIDIGSINLEKLFEAESFTVELPLILPNGITSEENITSVTVTVNTDKLIKTNIRIEPEDLPESEAFTYVSGLDLQVWTLERHAASLSDRSVDVELSYYPDDLVPGYNEIPVVVTAVDASVVILGEYSVVVEVSDTETGNTGD